MFAFAWSEHNLARCGRLASSYGFYLTLLIFTCRKYYVQLHQMRVQFKDPFTLLASKANATSTHICASSLKVHSHDATSSVTTSIFSWDKQWVLWQEMDVFTLTEFASVTFTVTRPLWWGHFWCCRWRIVWMDLNTYDNIDGKHERNVSLWQSLSVKES